MPRLWQVKSKLQIMPISGSGNAIVTSGLTFFVWLNDPPILEMDLSIVLEHPENKEWEHYGSRVLSFSTIVEKVSDVAIPKHSKRHEAPENLSKVNGTVYCRPLLLPTCLGGDSQEAFKMRAKALGENMESYQIPNEEKISVRKWMACGYCAQEPSPTWFERTEDGSELTELGQQEYLDAMQIWEGFL